MIFVEVASELFVCPRCGEQKLSIHRKTYEKTILVFCDNCQLTSSFEPSQEAYYDLDKSWEEFITNYKITQIN